MSDAQPERGGVQDSATVKPRGRSALMLPLTVFLILAGLFLVALNSGDPSRLPSMLIGKPVPSFELPGIEGLANAGSQVPGFRSSDLEQGELSIVNVWASWCVPCRDEHPLLTELIARTGIKAYGLNYKDQPENARRFLDQLGNPFHAVGADPRGRVGIDWGVTGVPETFLIDGKGNVAYKHIGPLLPRSIERDLLPAIERAKQHAVQPR